MSSVISGLGDFFFLVSFGHWASRSGFFQNFYSAQFLAFLNLRFSISISGGFFRLWRVRKGNGIDGLGRGLIR